MMAELINWAAPSSSGLVLWLLTARPLLAFGATDLSRCRGGRRLIATGGERATSRRRRRQSLPLANAKSFSGQGLPA
jgi:hypothetical protein